MDENRVNNKENKNNSAVLCFIFLLKYKTYIEMMKNDAGVLLSSFLLQSRANKKEQFSIPLFQMFGFLDEFNIMILFIDEYVSVFRMEEVSFVETSSILDETDISMNMSIGGADGG